MYLLFAKFKGTGTFYNLIRTSRNTIPYSDNKMNKMHQLYVVRNKWEASQIAKFLFQGNALILCF